MTKSAVQSFDKENVFYSSTHHQYSNASFLTLQYRENGGKIYQSNNVRSLTEKSIVSTFEGGNGSYGNVFDVIALKRVTILGLEIHTDANSTQEFEVYTKRGGFSDCQNNLTCWGTPISSGSITPKGRREPTPLPFFADALVVEGTERQAFYVTLKSQFLRYSNGTNTGEVFVENHDLQILAGDGIGHYPLDPRNSNFHNRIWNGVILYDAADDPSSSPTTFPTTNLSNAPSLKQSSLYDVSDDFSLSPTTSYSPTIFGMVDSSIFCTSDGDREGFGSMFDMKVLSNLSVTGMDILTSSNDEISFEVWTKPDSHFGSESSSEHWRLVSQGSVLGNGPYQFTSIPKNLWLYPVRLLANSTQAFYVTLSEQKLLYSTGFEPGDVPCSNEDLLIMEGTGFSGAGFSTSFFSPRLWNGGIQYLSFPSILPNNGEGIIELSANAKVSLTGLSFQMDLSSSATFESIVTKILNDRLIRAVPPIHALRVNVTGQEIVYSSRPKSRALRDHLLHFSEFIESAVVVDTIVTGEYQPPPYVDFDSVVEESINEESEMMINKLKEHVFFEKVSGINTISEAEIAHNTSVHNDNREQIGCGNVYCPGGKEVFLGSAGLLITFLMLFVTCCFGREKDPYAQGI